jgi:hypothetical protein
MPIISPVCIRWKTDDLQFEIVNTIDGAVNKRNRRLFYVERFMTKPLVDQGIF